MMLLRSLAFFVRVLAVCVILFCSSARAFTCPGKIYIPMPCTGTQAIGAYTALLFTLQFVFYCWENYVVSTEITKAEQQLEKLTDLMKQRAVMEEMRSIKTDNTSFMAMLEKLKKYYDDNGKAKKVKKVKDVLRSYRMAPSYYVLIYSLSPYSYEHCLRRESREFSCKMIPVGKEPLKLMNLNGLTTFFDQLIQYSEQQTDMLYSMQITFDQLFQIAVSYCGNYLNTDTVTASHPCMKMLSVHIQNYLVINDDWSRIIKTVEIETETAEPGEDALKLVTLNEGAEPLIGQYKMSGYIIEPVERDN